MKCADGFRRVGSAFHVLLNSSCMGRRQHASLPFPTWPGLTALPGSPFAMLRPALPPFSLVWFCLRWYLQPPPLPGLARPLGCPLPLALPCPHLHPQAVKVNTLGKWKTALQMVSMSVLLVVRQPLGDLLPSYAGERDAGAVGGGRAGGGGGGGGG